ncbi:hypothetical protein T12_3119 [Trichinella patagoniensis]|uniref:Uncharacterized protein n=1 Tax=Trichinella patagoniensis TaxID=990121 RepID=A0A0V1AFB5_9BILA|nr:hypothetical protein T12_3119 [Trichinella patagoniensis]
MIIIMSKDEDNEVSLEDAMQHKLEKYEKMFKDRYSEKDSTFEKATFPPALVVVGYRMRHFNRDQNRFPRDRFRRDHFAQDRFHRDRSPLDRF